MCLTKRFLKNKNKKQKHQKYFKGCGCCLSGWVRDTKRRRLIIFEPEPKPESHSNYKPELKMEQERPLNDIFRPRRTTLPLCFNLNKYAS